MAQGLLESKDSVRIRLAQNREITSACDEVFQTIHQDEARLMIYESEYLFDYVEEFSELLRAGRPSFAMVTEPERQTAFRYQADGSRAILLTRAHHGIEKVLQDLN